MTPSKESLDKCLDYDYSICDQDLDSSEPEMRRRAFSMGAKFVRDGK